MPLNILLNTQSAAVYNNSLKKACSGMRLGVNKSVNLEMKSFRVRHMNWAHEKSADRPLIRQIRLMKSEAL